MNYACINFNNFITSDVNKGLKMEQDRKSEPKHMQRQLSLLTQIKKNSIGKTYKSIDPYGHQKSRINQHKHNVQEQHEKSPGGITQLQRVFDILKDNLNGLTDADISYLIEFKDGKRINPSTVSARRNDIKNGKKKGYTIIEVIGKDGKTLIRDKGIVHKLKIR